MLVGVAAVESAQKKGFTRLRMVLCSPDSSRLKERGAQRAPRASAAACPSGVDAGPSRRPARLARRTRRQQQEGCSCGRRRRRQLERSTEADASCRRSAPPRTRPDETASEVATRLQMAPRRDPRSERQHSRQNVGAGFVPRHRTAERLVTHRCASVTNDEGLCAPRRVPRPPRVGAAWRESKDWQPSARRCA